MIARCKVQGAGCKVQGARCKVQRARAVLWYALCPAVPRAVLLPSFGTAQGRIANAKTETRSAAQGLEREVRAVAARGGAAWIGYRMPMVAGPRQMCCFDTISDGDACCGVCRLERGGGVSMSRGDIRDRRGSRITLEPPTEFLVLARLEGGVVGRVRTFTPDCDIDATGMPLVWLNDVKPDDSLAWLASLVTAAPDAGERRDRVAQDGDRRDRPARRAGRRSRRSKASSRRRSPNGSAATRRSGSAASAAKPARGCSRGCSRRIRATRSARRSPSACRSARCRRR